ncbi:hypothetical protein RHMOL_Rhmol03G0115100 [Rhododendron molle]|uniref:Uncharacterized protein n=1 Tax=Rhododendron molle TaxID=49168 RepID=A0ACC0PEL0_RHOML|nr:hypothetical protein RHMOL_Rhmol03G0115100 [Rhododendron molle]
MCRARQRLPAGVEHKPLGLKVTEVISRVSEGVERNVAFELLDDGLQKVFGQLQFGSSDDTVVRQIKALATENLVLRQRAEDTFSNKLLAGSKVGSSFVGPVANPVGISGQFEVRPTPLSVPVVAADLGVDCGTSAGQVGVTQGRASLAARGPGASPIKDLAVQGGSDPPVIGGWETPVFQQDRPRAGKAPAGVVLKEPVGLLHTVAQVSAIAKAAGKILTRDVSSSQLSNTFAVLDSTVTVEGQLPAEEGMVPPVSLSLGDSSKLIPPIVDPGAKKKPKGRGKK